MRRARHGRYGYRLGPGTRRVGARRQPFRHLRQRRGGPARPCGNDVGTDFDDHASPEQQLSEKPCLRFGIFAVAQQRLSNVLIVRICEHGTVARLNQLIRGLGVNWLCVRRIVHGNRVVVGGESVYQFRLARKNADRLWMTVDHSTAVARPLLSRKAGLGRQHSPAHSDPDSQIFSGSCPSSLYRRPPGRGTGHLSSCLALSTLTLRRA